MNEQLVGTLTEEEVAALGANDNPVVDAMLKGEARSDPRGRPVISYRQYQELLNTGQRLDNFMMVMQGPTGRGLVQASKYQKWFGEGFLPPELIDKEAKVVQVQTAKQAAIAERDRPAVVSKDDLIVYYCHDKYPECPRFFDSPRGRQTHYGLEHERKWKGKKEK